jgi:hypothetical protein
LEKAIREPGHGDVCEGDDESDDCEGSPAGGGFEVDIDIPDEIPNGEEDDDRFVRFKHEVGELIANIIRSVSSEEIVLVDPIEQEESNDEYNGGFRDQKSIEVNGIGKDDKEGIPFVEVVYG